MKVRFSVEPIDPGQIYRLMESNGSGRVGSVVMHFAEVKAEEKDGSRTAGIEYRATGDVERNLEAIVHTLKERWNLHDVVLQRRCGRVMAGEIISLVAAGSPDSKDAFEACQFGIECLKAMPTIAKTVLRAER